jgi:hypothetical protein
MKETLTIEREVHFDRRGKGARKVLADGPQPQGPAEPGRVPRVARLMALALRFDGLVRSGAVKDYAALARLGHVTRARISQIMSLLHLAPDLQEALLFLPRTQRGRDPLVLHDVLPLTALTDWRKQRPRWRDLRVVTGRGVTRSDQAGRLPTEPCTRRG